MDGREGYVMYVLLGGGVFVLTCKVCAPKINNSQPKLSFPLNRHTRFL